MNPQELKKLKSEARNLDPIIRLGKRGLTDSSINQIYLLLKKRRLVKVRFLQAFSEGADKDDAIKALAERTGAEVVSRIGSIVVLYLR